MDAADRHIRMIRDHLVADRDAWIADEQRRADEAAAAGDERSYRRHLEEIAEIKAKWFSWERSEE